MRRELGFTLVEVLVASAIIMITIGVLMQLFASGLGQNKKAGQMAHLLIAERVIVHILEGVNPSVQNTGEGVAEDIHYQWDAVVGEPFVAVFDPEGFTKRKIALFTITVYLETISGKKYSFQYEKLGWQGQ